MRSPLLKGGGRAFGPKPHAYTLKLNKKVKDLAKKSALSYKAKAGNILVLETFQLAAPKTKDFLSLLTNLNIAGNKSLVLLGEQNQNLALSARNLPYINLTDAKLLNTFDVMKAQKIVLTEDAVKVIEENFSNN
jgi:large subunit ribosomal protein L4